MVFFQHTFHHDNTVAAGILKPETVKMRNKRSAISMVGLLASWTMQMWYIVLVGLLKAVFKDPVFVRDVSTLVKMVEFVCLPFVQIVTSEPLRNFIYRRH
jgi:hypothetical protein